MNNAVPAFFLALFFCAAAIPSAAQTGDIDRYRQTIRYGTETEINKLIQILRQEKITSLDTELQNLAVNTKSAQLRQSLVAYFTQSNSDALSASVLDFLRARNELDSNLISVSLDYTAKKGGPEAAPVLKDIIENGETRHQGQALKAYGKVLKQGGASEKEAGAEFLLGFYREKANSDETRRVIIEALGEGEFSQASEFLAGLINNGDENSVLRGAALNAAGKLGDTAGDSQLRKAVTGALNAPEPLVRMEAVGALGAFAGAESDAALLDALRDSFFRTRYAAVKALSTRKLPAAVEFLEYRAKNDEAANVREESVQTLGAYQSAAADTSLEAIYDDKHTPEKVRLLAAEMLVKNHPGKYTKKFMTDMDEAKRSKQKSLYAGLVKALSASNGNDAQALVEALLAGADVADQSYALDIIGNNKLSRFRPRIEQIAEDPKNSLNQKAKITLEKLK
ncbi:MAG: HEAT repeat domain-containing protein [Spirochaetaceae bacterium]|jgi:HEAT repeat protein|nr:HEAT repeat domain-containing protein [Spirochaetaceae bacterium]